MADKHAVLELGDEDLQFSSHDYSTQVVQFERLGLWLIKRVNNCVFMHGHGFYFII